MSWVINLNHWLTEDGLPAPGRAGKNAAYLGQMVTAATAHGEEDGFASVIDCSRRPGLKPCEGKIMLYLHADGVIEWRCDCCAYQGFLTG